MSNNTSYPLYNINRLPNLILLIFLSAIWFSSIFSNFIPFNTEIFPWGIFAFFFLRVNKIITMILLLMICLLYTYALFINVSLAEFLRAYGPIFNILLIVSLINELDVESKIRIVKLSILLALLLNYFLLFLEIFDLDKITYYFFPARADEPGFINFSYNNRFNLLTPEPSRASVHLFSLGVASLLVFKKNHFFLINLLIDLIFIRSLMGFSLWSTYFILFKFRYLIFALLSLPILLSLNFFDFDIRALSIINSLINFDISVIRDIVYYSGHRLVSIMMAYELILQNPLGYGFVDNSKILQEFYQNNYFFYNQFLEPTQMQKMFDNGGGNLVSIYFNILFSLGIIGLIINIFIIYKIFQNTNNLSRKFKVALYTSLIFGIFLIDKGVTDYWIMVTYIKIFYNQKMINDFS